MMTTNFKQGRYGSLRAAHLRNEEYPRKGFYETEGRGEVMEQVAGV